MTGLRRSIIHNWDLPLLKQGISILQSPIAVNQPALIFLTENAAQGFFANPAMQNDCSFEESDF